MVGCVVTEHEWPAIARARTVAVVQNAPSQGASTSPFTSQRCRLVLRPFRVTEDRPVDWHGGRAFFTRCRPASPYHSDKCSAATGHVFCTEPNRPFLFSRIACGSAARRAAVRSLTFHTQTTHTCAGATYLTTFQHSTNRRSILRHSSLIGRTRPDCYKALRRHLGSQKTTTKRGQRRCPACLPPRPAPPITIHH